MPDRCCLIERETQGEILAGFRQYFERQVQQHAQRSQCTCHQSRNIVPGDVFDYPSAETQIVALATDDACTENKIAHRTGVRSAWSRQPRSDSAADSAAITVVRGFERQYLRRFVHDELDFGKRRASPHRQHQFPRFVFDDACVGTHIQWFTYDCAAIKSLGIAAVNGQRRFVRHGVFDARDK